MFPLGTSFVAAEGLLSTITSAGEIMPTPTTIFAAPVTIQLKLVCTFCENSFELENDIIKTAEMKQLEGIATEYFKNRVLRVEDGSLLGGLFQDEIEETRLKKLLNSIVLCTRCIFRFAKSEEKLLRDQWFYLEKMKGMKRLEDVFSDPWLDVKRLAYQTLTCHESFIKEKLDLMEKLFVSEEPMSKTSADGNHGATAVPSTSSTTSAQQLLMNDVNVPTCVNTSNNELKNRVGQDLFSLPEQSVAQPEQSSKLSSCVGSPHPEIEAGNDASSVQQGGTIINLNIVSVETSDSDLQNVAQNECLKDSLASNKNEPNSSKTASKPTGKKPKKEDGNISEVESVKSSRSRRYSFQANATTVGHMSPVVRLEPLAGMKTPSPSMTKVQNAKNGSGNSIAKPKTKKLCMDDDILDFFDNDDTDVDKYTIIDVHDQQALASDKTDKKTLADQDKTLLQTKDSSQNDGNNSDVDDTQNDTITEEPDENNSQIDESNETVCKTKSGKTLERSGEKIPTDDSKHISEKEENNLDDETQNNGFKLPYAALGIEVDDDDEQSPNPFEESESNEEDNDSDWGNESKSSGKRKRKSEGAPNGKRKTKKKSKLQAAKKAKLSPEAELSLTTAVTETPKKSKKSMANTILTSEPSETKQNSSVKKAGDCSKRSIDTSKKLRSKSDAISLEKNNKSALKTNGPNKDDEKSKYRGDSSFLRRQTEKQVEKTPSAFTRKTSSRTESITPDMTKKVFRIGNRYMTEDPSDEDDDSDASYEIANDQTTYEEDSNY